MTTFSAPCKAVGVWPRFMALLALVTLGAVLRFSVLEARSFWRDGAVTVLLLRLDFLAMLHTIPGSEGVPPFYYIVAWLWCRLFGTGEAGVRALSALIGTATIPVTYLVAARLVSPRAG